MEVPLAPEKAPFQVSPSEPVTVQFVTLAMSQ